MRIFFAALLSLSFATSFAQPKRVVADRIVAQVGDKIILRSDIINAISDYKRAGQEGNLPANPECAFLEGQLIQKALLCQAERDSLVISQDEIDAAMDNQIRSFIRQYGSQQVLEEVAGKSVFQIKEDFKQVFKDRKLADQMRAKIIDNIKVTPNEVYEYYKTIPKDSLAYYESELELLQIILLPKANKDVDDYIVKQLYEYKRLVESGAKQFANLAKLYTEDPGSKETGGQYTFNRNDKGVDPTFLATCFKIKEGQISNVIKSKFGYHIIQLISRNGDDAIIRHILKIPPITEDEIKICTDKLDSIKVQLNRKDYEWGYALARFTEDELSKQTGGQVSGQDGSGYITIDQLDKEMVALIKDLKPGEYSKPQVYVDQQGQKKVRMIYFKTKTAAHRENVKDDYSKLSNRLIEEKKTKKLEAWFKEHIPNFYIKIDNEFNNCTSINDWKKFAKKD